MTNATQYIVGIAPFYHDSAACILADGDIVAAAQEERFPRHTIDYCLQSAGIKASDLAYVGFYDKPLLKFEGILETYISLAPVGLGPSSWRLPCGSRTSSTMEKQIRDGLAYEGEILYAKHHKSRAASAFFPSPFEEAAILTMDGVGEWGTDATKFWTQQEGWCIEPPISLDSDLGLM